MQKTLRNKGGRGGGGGVCVHDFMLNVMVRYRGRRGGHFSPFFALRNTSMASKGKSKPFEIVQHFDIEETNFRIVLEELLGTEIIIK